MYEMYEHHVASPIRCSFNLKILATFHDHFCEALELFATCTCVTTVSHTAYEQEAVEGSEVVISNLWQQLQANLATPEIHDTVKAALL